MCPLDLQFYRIATEHDHHTQHTSTVSLTVLDDLLSLPDHGHHGATGQEVDQLGEEGLAVMLSVVLGSQRLIKADRKTWW
jgi:hypothetical protein